MFFIEGDLAFVSRSNLPKLNELRKECLGQKLINKLELQVELPHRTRVPQLSSDAIGVNYSFHSWEDQKSAMALLAPRTQSMMCPDFILQSKI